VNTRKIMFLALTTILCLSILPGIAYADTPIVGFKSIGETTGALAKEADATVHVIIEWEHFSANKTINIWCYNKTGDLVDKTETAYVIPVNGTTGGLLTGTNRGTEGEYETTYTIPGLTDTLGTHTYTMKLLDNTDNTTLAYEDFTVYVAEEDIQLAVSVDDADGDDVIELGESVVFTYYIDWVSVESTETHQIYVAFDDDTMKNKGSISITSGAGSDTGTYSKVWNTKGAHTVDVELRDPSGTVIASIQIPLAVGQPTSTVTPVVSTTTTTGLFSNPIVVITAIAGIVALVAVLKEK